MNSVRLFFSMCAVLAFPFMLRAQLQPFTKFTKDDVKEDFKFAVELLKKQHPNPYKFQDSVTFNRKFDSLLNKMDKDDNVLSALRYSPIQLLNDVHLRMDFNDHVNDFSYAINHFPLALAGFKNRIINNSAGGTIPFASEIISINNKSVPAILTELNSSTYSDGYIKTGFDRVNTQTGSLLSFIFPESTSYDVVYKEPGSKSTRKIQLQAADVSTAYHTQTHGLLPFNSFLRRSFVTKEYLPKDSTAILTVQSFMMDEGSFYKDLSNFFEEVDKRKINNVIIDIRNNGGGNPNMSALLYSFIALKPFDNVFDYRTKNIGIHNVENILSGADTKMTEEDIKATNNFLKQRFDYDSTYGLYKGNARLTEGAIVNYPPDKNSFKGNVYILIGGGTVSAATYYATLVKRNKRGLLIGAETGSGENSTTAAWFHTYSLPKTKARLTIPMSEIYFMNAKEDHGRGCMPDKELSFEQFQQYTLRMKDAEIEYTLDMIRGNLIK